MLSIGVGGVVWTFFLSSINSPTVLSIGAGGGGLDIFSLIYQFSLHSPSPIYM